MSVKSENIVLLQDFQQLFGEYDGITNNFTDYMEFLARRRRVVETMVNGDGSSLN